MGVDQPRAVETSAPAKVILFGEHAVNRGQPALALGVGIRARCTVEVSDQPGYRFRSGHERAACDREHLRSLRAQIDAWQAMGHHDRLVDLASQDFFSPLKYILAHALPDGLIEGLEISFESEIPPSVGLGSGAACFVAFARALATLQGIDDMETIGRWAYLGELVAHGGTASGLDSQTSLRGGFVRFTEKEGAMSLEVGAPPRLVVANTRVVARTSEVNAEVRRLACQDPRAGIYFQSIGLIASYGIEALCRGDHPTLGRLMSLNQLLLERIGVSAPALERVIAAGLQAGALGAKLSGSGGGGIVLCLVADDRQDEVVTVLSREGAHAFSPEIGASGARVEHIG